MRNGLRLLLGFAGILAIALVVCLGILGPCWRAWAFDGILVSACPAGRVRPVATVSTEGLGRGFEGSVRVAVTGHTSAGPTPIRRHSNRFTLTDPAGRTTNPITVDTSYVGFERRTRMKLPDGPDGDWTLHVVADTPAGESAVDLVLPLFAPALAHLLTDAPLYQPGQTVSFRVVLLDEGDLRPLAERPGRWTVTDPDGVLLLDEKGVTSRFGVAASSLPLAGDAPTGAYSIRYQSGNVDQKLSVEVRRFQLPRFTLESSSEQAFWTAGESPVVNGMVRYTSGAPVRNATVRMEVTPTGAWPPPVEWLEERTLRTDTSGRFQVRFGPVPADLSGQVQLDLRYVAVDGTGAVARGSDRVLLSADRIVAEAVTELADGLVPAANNRVYVRVTTPTTEPLRGARILLQREWDATDPGVEALTDADGVARVQLDPGEPTTVVIPPMPVRAAHPLTHGLVVGGAEDRLAGQSLGGEARRVLDGWAAAADACVLHGDPGVTSQVRLVARIDPSGKVVDSHAEAAVANESLARCVAEVVERVGAPSGADRVWVVEFQVPEAQTPWLTPRPEFSFGDAGPLMEALTGPLREARRCVAGVTRGQAFAHAWYVHQHVGDTRIQLEPTPLPGVLDPVPADVIGCVREHVGVVILPTPAPAVALGILRFEIGLPPESLTPDATPTTFPGYAFRVSATVGGRPSGDTLLRLHPGTIPPLRLRFSEVLVDPGDTVEVVALRGPDFNGKIEDELALLSGDQKLLDIEMNERKGSFVVPAEARGYLSVASHGAKAVLYVRDPRHLEVRLKADPARWKPGADVTLQIETQGATGPVAAGVTLSGVDQSFSALAPLPGADTFSAVTVRAQSAAPAFGVLDARALQTGQIHGENAAQATVLRVSALPPPTAGSERVSTTTAAAFDPAAEWGEAFFAVYAEVVRLERAWERSAPAEEKLTSAQMHALWERALAAVPRDDPFGRPLHLSLLVEREDFVSLVDPRNVVRDATRLPEDMENWRHFLSTEAR